jgi:putative NADH-flavin reductase
MKIGILGATGGTGLSLLAQALARGHEVVAVVRSPDRLQRRDPRLTVAKGDVRAAESLAAPLAGCDVVVSCVGVAGLLEARKGTDLYSAGTRNVLAALGGRADARLIAVSSGGVEPQPSDGWFYRRILKPFFLEPSYADMRIMEAELRASPVAWTIVRPPYLTGPLRTDYRVSADGPFPEDRNLGRESLAHFLLREAEAAEFVRRVVWISD